MLRFERKQSHSMVMLQLGKLSKLRERQLTPSMAFISGNVRFRSSLEIELPCSEGPDPAHAVEKLCVAVRQVV